MLYKVLSFSLLAVLLVGCGEEPETFRIYKEHPECGEPDEISKFFTNVLNDFWSDSLESSVWTCTYRPGDTLHDEPLPPLNAFSTGVDIVYYDQGFFDLLSLDGRSPLGVGALLAHEWAHELQTDHGLLDRFSIRVELQADCLAGVFVSYWSETDPSVELGDLAWTYLEFCLLQDPFWYPWFGPLAHGTCIQRALAFSRGLTRHRRRHPSEGPVEPFALCP